MSSPDPDPARLRRFLQETASLPPDRRLGRYRLLRKVGRGGMGVIYEAEDPDLRRTVALKVLRDLDPDSPVVQRLHREAEVTAQLNHPNIINVHEVGRAEDPRGGTQHFICMDYVEGSTFAERMPHLSLEENLRILETTARAIEFAHRRGIVHRDLKPANILIALDGRPIVTDFGLARVETAATKLTQSGTVIGTPHYMAPEQVDGRISAVGERCDVWALGVMLYEILAGRPPFGGRTSVEIFDQIRNHEPPVPRNAPKELATICLKALEKDLHRRYVGAGEVADDLERYRRGEPIHARPPSWTYRWRKALVRRRRLVVAVAASALLTAAAVLFGTIQFVRERSFENARQGAIAAREEGRWRRALAEAERALSIRRTPELERLAAESRARIDEEKKRTEKERTRSARYRRLQEEKIKPILTLIEGTRLKFYVPHVDIRKEVAALEGALRDLEKVAREPPSEASPDAWLLLGTGRHLLGDLGRAEEALLHAAPDPRAFLLLGRIHLERGVLARRFDATLSLTESRANLKRSVDLARSYFDRASAPSSARETLLLRAYQALLRARADEVERLCREGEKRFGREIGGEEFDLLRAYLALERYDTKSALKALSRALARRPHFALARLLRAMCYGFQWDPLRARKECTRAVQAYPKLALSFRLRAQFREALSEYAEALADVDKAVRLDPASAIYRLTRAHLLRHLGRSEDGIRDCTEAIRLAPNLRSAHAARAHLREDWADKLEAQGEFGEAAKERRKAYDDLRRAEGGVTPNSEDALRKAEWWGDLGAQIRSYAEALGEEPRNPFFYRGRGDLFGRSSLRALRKGRREEADRDWKRAEADLDAADRWTPSSFGWTDRLRGEYYHRRGEILIQLGEREKAFVDWRKADATLSERVRLLPSDFQAFAQRGEVRSHLGEYEKALADYAEVIRIYPRTSLAYLGRARIYRAQGKPDDARKEIARGLEHARTDEERSHLYWERGVVERAAQDWKRALEDFNAAVRYGKDNWEFRVDRALMRKKLGDSAGAVADLRVALRLAPKAWRGRVAAEELARQWAKR